MAKLVFMMAALYFSIVVGLRQAEIVRINPALSVVQQRSASALHPPESSENSSAPVYVYENNTWYCVNNCPSYTDK